ncbi:MAG: NAD-dependent epimerase/dehydratase family protein, partial [Chloroflexota bacterium]
MKIVIAGGSGHLGQLLDRALNRHGHQIIVLSRDGRRDGRVVAWDGRTLGTWTKELDGAGAVINLAGRSVNCRYTKAHRKEMMDSRVESTRVIGRAIEQAAHPPSIWLQMSTAT